MSDTEVTELAHYVFTTKKNKRDFIYEMKLLRNANYKYGFFRRWYYADVNKKPLWSHKGFNQTQQKQFDMKVVQKRDIMKYRVVKDKDKREK